ncbi:MAG: choice-of-anchor K domain-containing protein [Nannocystaceae bacterium]
MATVTTSGVWTSVTAAIAQLRGLQSNILSWGVPYPYGNYNPLRKQSSYTFDGVAGAVIPVDGSEFKLGTFTHNNFNLSPPLVPFSTNLKVTMTFDGGGGAREFNFTFQHNETVNSPGPVPDEVLLPSPQSKETVTLDGVEYVLELRGFKQDGEVVGKFVSPEDRANSADIFARLVPAPKPEKEPEPEPEKAPEPEPEPAPEKPEAECRVKHVIGVSTVFSAVLERLNRRSVVQILDQVIAEVNEHCERLPDVNLDVKAVLQQIEALNLKLTLIQQATRELDGKELGQIEALIRKLLLTLDLGPVIQNLTIEVDGRVFDMRRLIAVTATVDQVVNLQMEYADGDAGEILGVVFILTDGARVRFRVRTIEKEGDRAVVYVFETGDWKGLPAQFSLVYRRRARAYSLCKRPFSVDVFDGVEQTNVVFDLCPKIR